jgi:NADH-quinone oxidoreductase subunit C
MMRVTEEQAAALSDLVEILRGVHGEAILDHAIENGQLTVRVDRARLPDVARFLRDDPRTDFACFVDICAVDWPARPERFDVVTHLLSPVHNLRIRLKVATDERTPVPSLTPLWPAADWFEREAYDLYGVIFTDHPDLRRLLTDYGFDGYPLRKDFPLTGFVEVRYDAEARRVIYEPVRLPQHFRDFDFLSPWEGTDYVLPGDEKGVQH